VEFVLCGAIVGTGCNSSTAATSPTPAGVTLAPADTTIRQGASPQFRAAVVDSAGQTIAGILPTMASSDTAVLTVTSSGVGHTGSKIGAATVTASLTRLAGVDTIVLLARATVTVRDSSLLARLTLAGGPLGIAIGPAGVGYVTLDQLNQVARIDLATPSQTATIAVGVLPSYIATNSAGTQVYVANQVSDNIGVIDAGTNVQSAVIPVHGDPLPVAVSVHDSILFTTTNANFLYKIDIGTKTVVDSLGLPATSHHLLVHPNDTLVYVATRDAGSVLEVNWRTMAVARTFTLGGRTQGMAISPDAHELYVANELSNVLHVINLTTGVVAANIPLAGGGEGLALNADGSKLYVGLVFAGKVQVLDRVARTLVKTIVTGGTPREIAVDSPRQRMIVANEAGWIDFVR
jgi:YVTN family beta-propeller protein